MKQKFDIEKLPKYIGTDGKPIHHSKLPKQFDAVESPSFEGVGEAFLPAGNNGLGVTPVGFEWCRCIAC